MKLRPGRQAASCESTVRGVFISVWPVWCRLCRLHVPTVPPTNWGAQRHHTEISNLKKVSEQIWLSYFWNVFYQRTETNTKQTVRFNSRQTICLEQLIGLFRITSGLILEASLGAHLFICKSIFIHMKMSLICVWMKIDLHMKGWAPRLASKTRPEIIRKWPIRAAIILFFSIVYIFNTFLPIVSYFSARHIFIDFNLF